jgi:hypothetical protein
MAEGWYLMHRGWMDSDVFADDPYTEREAWEWMIAEAAFDEKTISINGMPTKLKRGQFSHSLRFMATAWKWDKNKAQRFIQRLIKWGMIEIAKKSGTGQLILSVCNYSDYQNPRDSGGTDVGQKRDSGGTNNKETIKQLERNNSTSKKDATPFGIIDPKNPHNYKFNGFVIRLSDADFEAWRKMTQWTDKDLWDELDSRDNWYKDQPEYKQKNWFIATSKYLQKEAGIGEDQAGLFKN